MQTGECGLVRSHAVVVQIRYGHHALIRHILLRKHNRHFARAIITIIKEDHYIAFLNLSERLTVTNMHNRLNELVRYIGIVGCLHSLMHILEISTDTVHQTIVRNLHAFPTFVTVHGIETSLNCCDFTGSFLHLCFEFINESDTRTRVGITTIHKAMYKRATVQTIFFCYLQQEEQMVKRTVHTAVGCQTHDVQFLTALFRMTEGRDNLRILTDRAILASVVDFH